MSEPPSAGLSWRHVVRLAVLLALLGAPVLPVGSALASTDAQLSATIQLPEGNVEFDLVPGTFHFFDEEDAPFVVQVIDGCAVNGRYWVLGAGLAGEIVPLTVVDERSQRTATVLLPAFEPGGAVGTVLEPEALAICRAGPTGGLPEASGVATLTSVTPRCTDATETVVLLSEGRADGYRAFVRNGTQKDRVIREGPIAIVDERTDGDSLFLFAEGRTPRQVEGVLFSGPQGMLPRQASLDKALADITRSRVRRAFEAAKGWNVPQPLIKDLGLGDVTCVYHVGLDLDSSGAAAYLAQAGWIEEGSTPLIPPQPVAERFTVDLVSADGTTTRLPLSGPLEGSANAGRLWEYGTDGATVLLVEACAISGTYWIVAGARTDEPLELVVGDPQTGASVSQILWTDREAVSRLADTVSLDICS
jgi:hypothetical protein